jgi:exonuclease III
VAIAEVECEPSIAVISVYGIIEHGYAGLTVHRILSDLTPLIDERRGRRIILAGDLNITTQWSARDRSTLKGRHKEFLRRELNLFGRFEALGLRNVVERKEPGPLERCECHLGAACRHVQTQRHDRSTFPWQNDYLFVSEDLLREPFTVDVIDQEDVWALSGHCPIVVEFSTLQNCV